MHNEHPTSYRNHPKSLCQWRSGPASNNHQLRINKMMNLTTRVIHSRFVLLCKSFSQRYNQYIGKDSKSLSALVNVKINIFVNAAPAYIVAWSHSLCSTVQSPTIHHSVSRISRNLSNRTPFGDVLLATPPTCNTSCSFYTRKDSRRRSTISCDEPDSSHCNTPSRNTNT